MIRNFTFYVAEQLPEPLYPPQREATVRTLTWFEIPWKNLWELPIERLYGPRKFTLRYRPQDAISATMPRIQETMEGVRKLWNQEFEYGTWDITPSTRYEERFVFHLADDLLYQEYKHRWKETMFASDYREPGRPTALHVLDLEVVWPEYAQYCDGKGQNPVRWLIEHRCDITPFSEGPLIMDEDLEGHYMTDCGVW